MKKGNSRIEIDGCPNLDRNLSFRMWFTNTTIRRMSGGGRIKGMYIAGNGFGAGPKRSVNQDRKKPSMPVRSEQASVPSLHEMMAQVSIRYAALAMQCCGLS